MNNFEQGLRKIVGRCEYIRNPKYVGRACVGRLDDNIVVKMEFESTMIRDKYNALRVTLMKRSEGKIDSQLIRFNELWGVKHIRIQFRIPWRKNVKLSQEVSVRAVLKMQKR